MQKCFKVEERNVSIRWSLLGQPVDYENGEDSYALSGGLMLEGCHSISGEPQNVNPPHYGRWFWHCLSFDKHYKFSIRFKSELPLGQSKTSTASRHRRSLVFAVCGMCMAPSCMDMAGPAAGGCQGVWHSVSVEDLVEIPPSSPVCAGFRPMAVCNCGNGTTTPWRKRLRRHVVAGYRQDGDAERDVLWRPRGSPYRAYLARIPRTVISGISKIRPMVAAFIPATEVPTTRHRWASVVLIVAVWR